MLALPQLPFLFILMLDIASSVGPALWKPGACGAVKQRCIHDSECPKGCGTCLCETGGGGPKALPPKCQNPYGGDIVHGFCVNSDLKSPDGRCGGPPIPIESYAKGKKQYLMIGDSVAGILFRPVNHSLTNGSMHNTIQPYIVPINGGDTREGADCIAEWVGTDLNRWDVISMNFGMHNIGPDDVSDAKDPKTGKYVDKKLETYIEELRNISNFMLQTRAGKQNNLIWVSTQPTALCPECCNDPHNAIPGELGTHTCTKGIAVYNKAAWEVLQPLGFRLADLYTAAQDRCGKTFTYNCDIIPQKKGEQCQVHPGGPGPDYLAKVLLSEIVKAAGTDAPGEGQLIV